MQQYQIKLIRMSNPECVRTIDPSTIYLYSTHRNVPWNITEYNAPKTEMHPDLSQRKKRWHSQPKFDPSHPQKRGYYLDYHLKQARKVPSSSVHGSQQPWNFQAVRKSGAFNKINPKLSKNTYLDKIEIDQKKRKVPGVCSYSLREPIPEKISPSKQKIKIEEKSFFHQNIEMLAAQVPGVGNYCPRLPTSKQKRDKTNRKFWAQKHKEEQAKFKKEQRKKPGPSSFTPLNSTLNTFQQLAISFQKPHKEHFFGLDSKFEYTREIKKKEIEKRPDPTMHSTIIQWKGKGINPKSTSLNDIVWKGRSGGVYH